MNTENCIFEIGIEEIPARFIPVFEKEIEQYFITTLQKELLPYTDYTVIASPRRIGFFIRDLASEQGTKEEVILGPSPHIARDAEGNASPALLGFLKKTGATEDLLYTEKTAKGEYLAVKLTTGGKKTIDLLGNIFSKAILHLSSIQKMRWGTGTEVFARPICSLLGLYGKKAIDFQYGSCSTQNPQITFGHRILAPKAMEIPSADDYFTILETVGHVLPTTKQRKALIEEGILALETSLHARLVHNTNLLEENVNLCEYPYILLGDIEPKYLELPREIFLTSIESHQRSFGIEDASGKLLPHFVTVLNNDTTHSQYIKNGWERVLRARLEDAVFFYANDTKHTFKEWLETLENVTFINSLGTMRERSLRLQSLALHIGNALAPEQKDDISRAGLLCKTDLVSDVVKEFDTLQGIMGAIYAKQKGESSITAQAIAEQYLPSGINSEPPKTIGGIALALADKIDLLVGCFGMNMIPTGTADNQGLRRATLGIIRIILENSLTLDFGEIFSYCRTLYGARTWKLREEETRMALETFFTVRLKNYFLSLGFDVLCIDAVLHIQDTLPAIYLRLQALKNFIQTPHAMETFLVFKRILNIIEKQDDNNRHTLDDINGHTLDANYTPELLEEEAEKALHEAISSLLPRISESIRTQQYETALEQATELYAPLNTFFDSVLVLTKEKSLQDNRLRMLNSIICVLRDIVDIKELQI